MVSYIQPSARRVEFPGHGTFIADEIDANVAYHILMYLEIFCLRVGQ